MSDDVPIVRDLPQNLHTPSPDYFPLDQRATFMGYRRPDGRVGTRNYVLIVPTSMCASHEALQISTIAESVSILEEHAAKTRKEIEDDQNIALAILIGSVIIGIAMIVASAVHG